MIANTTPDSLVVRLEEGFDVCKCEVISNYLQVLGHNSVVFCPFDKQHAILFVKNGADALLHRTAKVLLLSIQRQRTTAAARFLTNAHTW